MKHIWESNKEIKFKGATCYQIECSCGKKLKNYSINGVQKDFFNHKRILEVSP